MPRFQIGFWTPIRIYLSPLLTDSQITKIEIIKHTIKHVNWE
jgi:hypothetical protein